MRSILSGLLLCLCLVAGAQAQPGTADQGELTPGAGRSATLVGTQPHTYRLTDDDALWTLTVTAPADGVFAYVVEADGRTVAPLARRWRGDTFRAVYPACAAAAAPCTLVIEGRGPYTVALAAGDTLRVIVGTLALNNNTRARINPDQPEGYTLAAAAGATLTLRVQSDRHPLYPVIQDAAGTPQTPYFTACPQPAACAYVLRLTGAAPFAVYLSGSGQYTLRLEAGDTVRERGRPLGAETVFRSADAAAGYVWHPLFIAAPIFSVRTSGDVDAIYLSDTTGQPVPYDTTFLDDSSGERVYSYAPVQPCPCALTLQIRGDYTVRLATADERLWSAGTLLPGTIQTFTIPAGRFALFSVPANDDANATLTLFFDDTSLLPPPAPDWLTATGDRPPLNIEPMAGGLRLRGLSLADCPCTLTLRLSGRMALSLSGPPPAGAIPVQLIQPEVNLRAGSSLNDPVVLIGSLDQPLLAIARSAAGDWLLALTDTQAVVWVFAGLVPPAEVSTLPVYLAAVPATATVTATMTATAAPVATAAAPTDSTPAAAATALPAPVCLVTSGGGVNRRRGPGTTFAIAGALRQNTTVAVIAQAYDAA
nr:hypothetical protein [Anaerolineae bacterium]